MSDSNFNIIEHSSLMPCILIFMSLLNYDSFFHNKFSSASVSSLEDISSLDIIIHEIKKQNIHYEVPRPLLNIFPKIEEPTQQLISYIIKSSRNLNSEARQSMSFSIGFSIRHIVHTNSHS